MIIQSIRLKNIRCYGEGTDGTGITISFQAGINRIAGRNGHGKSTLIESLGYALFLTAPEFEENFQLERYFLSHGAREAEIDVTFTQGEDTYRVERGLGKGSKRRSKVIQLRDGSICAENDLEVSHFLCALLRFPDPDRLPEMFSKLIGVKQGRLTWPFDSRPAEAKRFFEPLLDVAVFRECFDRLKPAVDLLHDQRQGHQQKRAEVAGRVSDRADSSEKLAACRQAFAQTTVSLGTARAVREEAARHQARLAQLRDAAEAARVKAEKCHAALDGARKLRELAEQAAQDAQAACLKLTESQAAHHLHLAALAALKQLETKRTARDLLQSKRQQCEQTRIRATDQSTAAKSHIAEFMALRNTKAQALAEWQARALPLRQHLERTKAAFELDQSAAKRAGVELSAMAGFNARLRQIVTSQTVTSQRILALASDLTSWKAEAAIQAGGLEKKSRETYESARDRLVQAQQRLHTLKEQLKEIAGGLCPFLKERCQQFDPAKVRADVEDCQRQIQELLGLEQSTRKSYLAAKAEYERCQGLDHQAQTKRTDLHSALKQYLQPISDLVPERVATAAAWLGGWLPAIQALPQVPPVPGDGLSPESISNLQAALRVYAESVDHWWEATETACHAHLNAFRAQELDRRETEQMIGNATVQMAALDTEIQTLEARIVAKQTEAAQQEAASLAAAQEAASLDEQLKPFAGLDRESDAEQEKRSVSQTGYEAYLRSKDVAEQFPVRKATFEQRRDEEAIADALLAHARVAALAAGQAFDPSLLQTAQSDLQLKHDAVTTLAARLEAQEKEVEAQAIRFREWQDASQTLLKLDQHIGRCEAAIALTELARKTLRDVAPEVAQHLCRRIARQAQCIFNEINPEPITLEWEAEHYSLRVTPGERRFAMLSGGEQTKLALAMTLAMIEQFCGLRFCIFDEPTYGVDAESRKKLADAIIHAQQAASLEQLLLVSHDDAFEGKIEHSIILNKSATAGTQAS